MNNTAERRCGVHWMINRDADDDNEQSSEKSVLIFYLHVDPGVWGIREMWAISNSRVPVLAAAGWMHCG